MTYFVPSFQAADFAVHLITNITSEIYIEQLQKVDSFRYITFGVFSHAI